MTCVQILVTLVVRISQLVAELFVVGITWWYTYQSYRIRKGVEIGKTISSILFYNGEPALGSLRCQLTYFQIHRKPVFPVRFTLMMP